MLLEDPNVKPPVSHALFFKWHGRYKQGRQSLEDDSGRGKNDGSTVNIDESV